MTYVEIKANEFEFPDLYNAEFHCHQDGFITMNYVKRHPIQSNMGQGTFGLLKCMNLRVVFNQNRLSACRQNLIYVINVFV